MSTAWNWKRFSPGALLLAAMVWAPAVVQGGDDAPSSRQEFLEEPVFENISDLFQWGSDQKHAIRVNEAIYQAVGFGNTFLVVTPAGNVVIDTSSVTHAPRHKKLLQAEDGGPIRYIILTHGHADHTGGVPLWKQEGTKIVAQSEHVEFMNYQKRLEGFFARRNAAQFSRPVPKVGPWAGNYGATIEATTLFDERHEFELGGLKFEVFHTPGETPDHLTVWIPKYKAAFLGDNYYHSFPNLYTLRGTQPRKALEYVKSLNTVLALKPELLLPSHELPVRGNAAITRELIRYRDAIQYVHDEVVRGMNAGTDVFTLMRAIHLPKELDNGEGYGRLTWSIRGIYEGYAGWFDLNPATMYDRPAESVYPDLMGLAGGADPVLKLARERLEAGQPVDSLHLTDVVLASEPAHRATLEVRLKALEALRKHSRNTIERAWLDQSIKTASEKLGGSSPAPAGR